MNLQDLQLQTLDPNNGQMSAVYPLFTNCPNTPIQKNSEIRHLESTKQTFNFKKRDGQASDNNSVSHFIPLSNGGYYILQWFPNNALMTTNFYYSLDGKTGCLVSSFFSSLWTFVPYKNLLVSLLDNTLGFITVSKQQFNLELV